MKYKFGYKLFDDDHEVVFSLDDFCKSCGKSEFYITENDWVRFSYNLYSASSLDVLDSYSIDFKLYDLFTHDSKLSGFCNYHEMDMGFTSEILGELLSAMILRMYEWYNQKIHNISNRYDVYQVFFMCDRGIPHYFANTLDLDGMKKNLLDWVEFFHGEYRSKMIRIENLRKNLTFLGFEESKVR